MNLPNHEQAIVPQRKIAAYLLSHSHRDGRSKARFFAQFGFSVQNWEELAQALRQHAAGHEITKLENSSFGMRYIIEGPITTPDGRTPLIRSVWFVANGETIPQFATAYPLKRKVS